jgi:hypothetical protein
LGVAFSEDASFEEFGCCPPGEVELAVLLGDSVFGV